MASPRDDARTRRAVAALPAALHKLATAMAADIESEREPWHPLARWATDTRDGVHALALAALTVANFSDWSPDQLRWWANYLQTTKERPRR